MCSTKPHKLCPQGIAAEKNTFPVSLYLIVLGEVNLRTTLPNDIEDMFYQAAKEYSYTAMTLDTFKTLNYINEGDL